MERTYHGADDSNDIALLHLRALLNPDLDNHTGHRAAALRRISGVGLGPRDVLDSSQLVIDGDGADLAVHLVEDVTLSRDIGQGPDSEELQDEDLALLELDAELLADLGLGEEVLGGQHAEVAVLLRELLVVVEHGGVHDGAGDVALGHAAPLLADLLLDLGEVDGGEEEAGALVELAAAAERVAAQRLGEAAVGLAHESLEEVEDGAGEVQLGCLRDEGLWGELVGDHELGKIADGLGNWSNLDHVTKYVVGLLVSLLGLRPLCSKAKLLGLEHHVGELATWDLVLVHLWIWASEVSLEWRVEETELRPVRVNGTDVVDVQAGLVVAALERRKHGANAGLGGHSRQAVSGSVDNIGSCGGAGGHGSDTSTGGVVSVDVDGEIGVLLADSANQESRSPGLEDTSHVLDAKNVDLQVDELVNNAEVVLQVVLLLWVQH